MAACRVATGVLLALVTMAPAPTRAQAVAAAAPAAPGSAVHEPVFQKGMTFTHGYRHHNNLLSPGATESLEHLRRRVHTEWIALNPFAYQRATEEPVLHFGGDPPDEHLRHAIREAHQLGLQVMVKPHIWLRSQSDEHWRGTIGMSSEEHWQLWWHNYERFVLHYARLSAQEGVEIFCVGVELSRTAREREADWRRLIARVREVYPGPLTYAANWWGEYDLIEFWDALDYIGINAFFPLSEAPDPGLEALRRGATRVADEIALLHQLTRRPVLLTEVGFKSVRGTSVKPWEWTRHREPAVSMEEQSLCYQAVLEAFWHRPWFYGMYWWKWYSDLQQGGIAHGGFTPLRKPAERVLADWYRRSPRASDNALSR
jgi:hypothetical protein